MQNKSRRSFQLGAAVAALGVALPESRLFAQTEGGRDGLGDRTVFGAKETLVGREALGMSGTINHKTREIYLVGALTDRDNFNTVIAVSLLNVPPGEWKVTKIEHNGQTKSWGLWALQLGFATRFNRNVKPASNLFTRFSFVPERNCLVFDKGAVEPSQTLIKSWAMRHTEGPVHVLHYERPEKMDKPLTTEQIRKGWGNKSIDQVMNINLQVIDGT